MIRQATRYLRGATSGVALVAGAVVVAAVLIVMVSTGTSPIAVLGIGDDRQVPLVFTDAEREAGVGEHQDRNGSGSDANANRAARQGGDGSPGGSERGDSQTGTTTERSPADREVAGGSDPSRGGKRRTGNTGGSDGSSGAGTKTTSRPRSEAGGGGSGGDAGGDTGGGSAGAGGGSASDDETPNPGSGSARRVDVSEVINETVDAVDSTLGGGLGKSGLVEQVKKTTNAVLGSEGAVNKSVGEVVRGLAKQLGKKK